MRYHWSKGCLEVVVVGRWALCGLRESQTATVTKAFCVCMDACVHVCVTVSGVTGQGFTRFVTSGQQKNIRQPGSFLLHCMSLVILSRSSCSGLTHCGYMIAFNVLYGSTFGHQAFNWLMSHENMDNIPTLNEPIANSP